jgi:hypothetical protein
MRRMLPAVLLILAAIWWGPEVAGGPGAPWVQVVAAARREGTLTLYDGHGGRFPPSSSPRTCFRERTASVWR